MNNRVTAHVGEVRDALKIAGFSEEETEQTLTSALEAAKSAVAAFNTVIRRQDVDQIPNIFHIGAALIEIILDVTIDKMIAAVDHDYVAADISSSVSA
jgi:hypothetical protein